MDIVTRSSEADFEAPSECSDPNCAGCIDETKGACILCGIEADATACRTCEQYGACDRSCPERGQ